MFTNSMNSVPSSYNIGDIVYFTLLDNIVNLNLKPGDALNVKSISEQLNVSRTPVRDALIKLAKEGLVDVFPQKVQVFQELIFAGLKKNFFTTKSGGSGRQCFYAGLSAFPHRQPSSIYRQAG